MRIRFAAAVLALLLPAVPCWAQTNTKLEIERLKALKAFCESLTEDGRAGIAECRGLDDPVYFETLLQRVEEEKHSRLSFLRWIHLDGPWLPMSNGLKMYGVVGMHVVVAQLGERFYVYGPPGVMLVTLSNGEGWSVRPAMTWGVSVHLKDFRVPGTTRKAQVFANLARCWLTGSHRNGIDMVGVSVTWKK